MEKLLNLPELKRQLEVQISNLNLSDHQLPDEFKQMFKSFGEYRIEEYYNYTLKVTSKKSVCYIPNQWIYIAAICSKYCSELKRYKQKLQDIGITDEGFESCHPSGNSVPEEQKSKEYVSQRAAELLSSYNGDDKDLLVSFLWDYDSWGGGKNIKRDNDFTVSPCLNIANSINASSTLIGDIAKAFSDKKDVYNSLTSSAEMQAILKVEIKKTELIRDKVAARFLRTALETTLSKDKGLSRLEKTEKYKTTQKNLFLNGFWLGRDKSQPPTRESDIYPEVAWVFDGREYVLNLEITPEAMEEKLFPIYNDAYKGSFQMEKNVNGDYLLYKVGESLQLANSANIDQQQHIFYGTPGSGKSHEVKKQTGELSDNGEERNLPNVFRTTFHPDTDYASFVGCYKPTMKPTSKEEKTLTGKDEEIVYEFVPQTFTDAYIYAYTHSTEQTYLVIEEINRGNCAQIFGDLFQLLDRKGGVSEYRIKADKDLANYLTERLGEDSEGIKDGKLSLPANLNILATMNTSDQSLFPMDSAFKRRWDWEYVPINYGTDIKSGTFEITIGEKSYLWVDFIKEINKRIFELTQSEDKQLGNFFIKHSVDEKEFKSKVMFYLWYEVLRDETENNKYFFYKKTTIDGKEDLDKFTFKDLYEQDATQTLQQFMEYLEVSPK